VALREGELAARHLRLGVDFVSADQYRDVRTEPTHLGVPPAQALVRHLQHNEIETHTLAAINLDVSVGASAMLHNLNNKSNTAAKPIRLEIVWQ
jgi:hypothetical protein